MSSRIPLFRRQALRAQQSDWLGPVVMASPLSHTLYVVSAIFAVIALILFVTFGQFTRKSRINGWLVPSSGLARVFVPQAGVIKELKVKEGSQVTKGEPLLVLSAERQSSARGATQGEITGLLESRRTSITNEIRQQELLFTQQRQGLGRRVDALLREIEQISREIEVQSARADLARKSVNRMKELGAQGFASVVQVNQQEELELDQRGRLRATERMRSERQRELVTLRSELDDLPVRHQTLLSSLARDVKGLEQELAESEAKREIVIPAPQSGTVTSVNAEVGGNATTATPLLSIIPAGSYLEANLFAPSRAIGFVKPGQRVQLRYQAYPYQKFGHQEGTIESVSRSALSPGEVPQQLAGLSSLMGANEPIYRIVVRLRRQSVTAYGVDQSLQPGMQLESDVLLESRKLWEWMVEPLLTLTGKIRA